MTDLQIHEVISNGRKFGLQQPQIASLEKLVQDDESISQDRRRLESLRRDIGSLALDDSLDVTKLQQLHEEAHTLERELRSRATKLSEQMRQILNDEQYQAYSASFTVPQEGIVNERWSSTSLEAMAGQWESCWPIVMNTNSSFGIECKVHGADYKVPYCFVVDTTRGTSGGYSLNVRREQGLRDKRVEPVILEGTQLHVGFRIFVRVCSESGFGRPGRFDADFCLYGRSV
jgi:hypothetical protein